MNNENKKIIGYDPQTGQPIYEIQYNQSQQPMIQQSNMNTQQQMNNPTSNLQPTKKENKGKLVTILIITNIITFIIMIAFIVAFIFKNPSAENIDIVEENKGYNNTATTKPVSSDWKEYQFSIKGKTLALPCAYQELSDISGFAMKSSEEKSYLDRRSSTYVNLYINDLNNQQKLALYIDIKNNTEEDMKYSDSEVVRISQTKYQVQTNKADKITFPGNLEVGMEITKEQIVELFGEANEIKDYSTENYSNIILSYNDDEVYSTINFYQIKLINGVIDELTLDHKKNK